MKTKCRFKKPIATTAPSVQPSGVISPAVVQPMTGVAPKRRAISEAKVADVIVGRDEHDEAREVVRRELTGDFGGRRGRARAPRRRDDDSAIPLLDEAQRRFLRSRCDI